MWMSCQPFLPIRSVGYPYILLCNPPLYPSQCAYLPLYTHPTHTLTLLSNIIHRRDCTHALIYQTPTLWQPTLASSHLYILTTVHPSVSQSLIDQKPTLRQPTLAPSNRYILTTVYPSHHNQKPTNTIAFSTFLSSPRNFFPPETLPRITYIYPSLCSPRTSPKSRVTVAHASPNDFLQLRRNNIPVATHGITSHSYCTTCLYNHSFMHARTLRGPRCGNQPPPKLTSTPPLQ